jgi:hypothetical protein
MKYRLTKVATLIGLTITATLGAATVAQAEGQNAFAVYVAGGQVASSASFEHLGEHVTVCDGRPDGKSAVALVNGIAVVWASGGAGTCNSTNLGIPEGTSVRLEACVAERAQPNQLTCGTPSWGIA